MKTLRPVLLALLVGMLPVAHGDDLNDLRGERVGWARLQTSSPFWRRHAESDPRLMDFLRERTTLNLDPVWHAADVERLDEMCVYPLLFSQGIHTVVTRTGLANLAEYLRRGGFLLIDACINPNYRGDPRVFLAGQQLTLARAVPEARVALLPNDHPLYNAFFHFTGGPPHTEDADGWGQPGLYGIFIGQTLAGVISLSGLQCGWAGMKQVAGHDERCMEMLVNIYIYAMLRGGAEVGAR
jgi:hypothetical protein